MKKSSLIILSLLAVFFLFGLNFVRAQSDKELLSQLVEEDQDAINALVLYPENVRLAILETTLHPEALIKLESIQSQTSNSFQDLITQYPRETQEMIWDLTRYPDLIYKLVGEGEKSGTEINQILESYPEVIHPRAKLAAQDHYGLLVNINELDQSAKIAIDNLLSQYSLKSKEAFEQLIELPEVLSILTENIRLTVLAGELYRKSPEWVLQKVDSISLEVAREHNEELEGWKESLENNPQAMEELKAASSSFEEEYGYVDDYYANNNDDLYYNPETDKVQQEEMDYNEVDERVVHHYYHHYPYWFGYPYWYYYPRWRIYPYWYDWGFYYGPGGASVVIGLPSFHFTYWYFNYPHHHHHWSHLSTHFVNHYYGYRNIGNSINTNVTLWRNQNRAVVTEEWMRNDGQLTKRFREFGKFESSREKYNQSHPQKAFSQKEYLDRHTRRYPNMTTSTRPGTKNEVIYRDPVYYPRTDPTVKESPRKTTTLPKTDQKTPTRVKKQAPRSSVPRVNKGKEYHQNTWERTKSSRMQIDRRPRPQFRTQPRTNSRTPSTTTPRTRTNTSKRKN